MLNSYNRRQTDFINAMNAISALADIAKRDPAIIVAAGLTLIFIGLILAA